MSAQCHQTALCQTDFLNFSGSEKKKRGLDVLSQSQRLTLNLGSRGWRWAGDRLCRPRTTGNNQQKYIREVGPLAHGGLSLQGCLGMVVFFQVDVCLAFTLCQALCWTLDARW